MPQYTCVVSFLGDLVQCRVTWREGCLEQWHQIGIQLWFCLQYLAEAGWTAEGRVVGVTQPRRVAAVTVSSSW